MSIYLPRPHTLVHTHTQTPTAAATAPLPLLDADDAASSTSASASATGSAGGSASATGVQVSVVASIGPSASQVNDSGSSVSTIGDSVSATGVQVASISPSMSQEKGASVSQLSALVAKGTDAGGNGAKGGGLVLLSGLQSDSFNFGIIFYCSTVSFSSQFTTCSGILPPLPPSPSSSPRVLSCPH